MFQCFVDGDVDEDIDLDADLGNVSVLGQDEGYTVKYNPRAKPKGTPEGKGLYLTVYPELSPNTDNISLTDPV